jgi:pectate lyase
MMISPTETARESYSSVLANAGAIYPKRDATDDRIIKEVKDRSAKGMGVFGKPGIIDDPMAVGGWTTYNSAAAPADTDNDGMPDEWEKKNKLNPNDPEDRNKTGEGGYTMLEMYLNGLVK